MKSFFQECVKAGPLRCPFFAPTVEDISRNLTALYNRIRDRPLPVRTASSYGLMDYTRLRYSVFVSLYQPFALFWPLAKGLADLAAGDASRLFTLLETPIFRCSCDDTPSTNPVSDAQAAIICNDGEQVPASFSELEKYFEYMMETSEWAELWAGIRTQCT